MTLEEAIAKLVFHSGNVGEEEIEKQCTKEAEVHLQVQSKAALRGGSLEAYVEAMNEYSATGDWQSWWAKNEKSFQLSLRPFRGKLRKDLLAEIDVCLEAVRDYLMNEKTLDRQLVAALWSISTLTKSWALHTDGMLRRNKLISQEDLDYLENWLAEFDWKVSQYLDGWMEAELDINAIIEEAENSGDVSLEDFKAKYNL